ncbi:hypothetical protein EsH8_IX_000218 [Colletotrichum jinshuiense]
MPPKQTPDVPAPPAGPAAATFQPQTRKGRGGRKKATPGDPPAQLPLPPLLTPGAAETAAVIAAAKAKAAAAAAAPADPPADDSPVVAPPVDNSQAPAPKVVAAKPAVVAKPTSKGKNTSGPAPPGGPAADAPLVPLQLSDDEDDIEGFDAVVRTVPCCRCLRQMVTWNPDAPNAGVDPLPRCTESTSASNKCARCYGMRSKECVQGNRTTASAAIALKNIFEELRTESDPRAAWRLELDSNKKAQLAGKKALQRKAENVKKPDHKRKAEEAEEEWLLRREKVEAMKETASAARKQVRATRELVDAQLAHTEAVKAQTEEIRSLRTLFGEWGVTYSRVHASDLDSEHGQALDDDEEIENQLESEFFDA